LALGYRLVNAVTENRAHLVGLNIRRARKLANLRQADLADLIGKPRRRVAEWEGGYHEPRPETLAAIAAATEQPLTFFYADNSSGTDE
jgi:transcriptional regulator with XRE-family HTH domain